MYTPADDFSRLKWPGEAKVILLKVAKECGEGTYMTIDELAPCGDESVELFYHAGDLTVPARSGWGHGHAARPIGTWAETIHKLG